MHKSRHSEDYICPWKHHKVSLRRRRLEVVGERENGRARGRHACLLLARPFFLVPTTSKHLLRRLPQSRQFIIIRYSSINNPTLHTLLINLAFSAKINWDCRPSKIDPIRCSATFGTSDMLSPKAFFFFLTSRRKFYCSTQLPMKCAYLSEVDFLWQVVDWTRNKSSFVRINRSPL